MTSDPTSNRRPEGPDDAMEKADVANGEGSPDEMDPDDAVNDTEERYGTDESPA